MGEAGGALRNRLAEERCVLSGPAELADSKQFACNDVVLMASR
jgi:hypothetical protein